MVNSTPKLFDISIDSHGNIYRENKKAEDISINTDISTGKTK